jgi:hypothetical protein
MPEKVRAFERRSLVVHKGIREEEGQAALDLLFDDDPEELDDPDDSEDDEEPFDESDDFDPEDEESDDDEEEDEASLLAGSVLVPEERLSLR